MPWNQDCIAGMAERGILNFPTIASVAQDQQQLLERLKNTSVEPSLYEGLEHCSAAKCGRPQVLRCLPVRRLSQETDVDTADTLALIRISWPALRGAV
jgi:hypothetical protein